MGVFVSYFHFINKSDCMRLKAIKEDASWKVLNGEACCDDDIYILQNIEMPSTYPNNQSISTKDGCTQFR